MGSSNFRGFHERPQGPGICPGETSVHCAVIRLDHTAESERLSCEWFLFRSSAWTVPATTTYRIISSITLFNTQHYSCQWSTGLVQPIIGMTELDLCGAAVQRSAREGRPGLQSCRGSHAAKTVRTPAERGKLTSIPR